MVNNNTRIIKEGYIQGGKLVQTYPPRDPQEESIRRRFEEVMKAYHPDITKFLI